MRYNGAFAKVGGYALAFAGLIVFWHISAILLKTPMLPAPADAFSATVRLMQDDLAAHLIVSTYRVLVSIVISFILGVPLGLVMGYEQCIDRFLAPIVYLTYPIPKIVFLPLILFFLGLGDASKIFLITFIVLFQILVTTRDAAKKVPAEMVDSLRSLGGTHWQVYRFVLFPAALPDVLTALRLSMGTAIAVLFFAESFATTEGLGYFIMDAWSRSAPAEMFAGIIMMGLLGVVLFLAVDIIDNLLCRWQKLKKQ